MYNIDEIDGRKERERGGGEWDIKGM